MRLFLLSAAAAATLACGAGASAQPGPGDDRDFLQKAVQGDNAEMRLGHMAQAQARDPAVRRFGAALVRDHAQARRQAAPIAAQAGVRRLDGMPPEAREEMQRLRGLRGHAFDREFVRYMVDDHQKDVSDFRTEADGRGPAARLARQTLPALQRHLDMAQDLQRRMG